MCTCWLTQPPLLTTTTENVDNRMLVIKQPTTMYQHSTEYSKRVPTLATPHLMLSPTSSLLSNLMHLYTIFPFRLVHILVSLPDHGSLAAQVVRGHCYIKTCSIQTITNCHLWYVKTIVNFITSCTCCLSKYFLSHTLPHRCCRLLRAATESSPHRQLL